MTGEAVGGEAAAVGQAPVAGPVPAVGQVPVVGDGVREESSRRKQMLVRALIYIAGTHLFAGFVILLFAVGGRH
ncbi:DUF6126 family protein [Kitasatospora saccharophila]|uniref:DUF6126 family protein n=1 Tax=Kitasatospora saccharophila TaxID=407973 RepID=UPI0031D45C4E